MPAQASGSPKRSAEEWSLSELTPPLGANDTQTPSEDDLRSVCEYLLRSWTQAYSGIGSIDLGSEDQEPDAVRFTIVLAFVAHSHHVTTAAADLMYAGDYLSAIPLLRLGYESALTAAWAAHSEDAARALQAQYVLTAQKLRGKCRDDRLVRRTAKRSALVRGG
jgi:hypothetical protein